MIQQHWFVIKPAHTTKHMYLASAWQTTYTYTQTYTLAKKTKKDKRVTNDGRTVQCSQTTKQQWYTEAPPRQQVRIVRLRCQLQCIASVNSHTPSRSNHFPHHLPNAVPFVPTPSVATDVCRVPSTATHQTVSTNESKRNNNPLTARRLAGRCAHRATKRTYCTPCFTVSRAGGPFV